MKLTGCGDGVESLEAEEAGGGSGNDAGEAEGPEAAGAGGGAVAGRHLLGQDVPVVPVGAERAADDGVGHDQQVAAGEDVVEARRLARAQRQDDGQRQHQRQREQVRKRRHVLGLHGQVPPEEVAHRIAQQLVHVAAVAARHAAGT